ncbi:hypothetical protein MMU07_21655, partial [Aquiflexum sp. LQ15W]|uniref:JAB-like toxin 1 domain-containing protein n=1 Tax=Cognataquiflexum nitidum TaxID=2922272 RepID=UPI001F12E719
AGGANPITLLQIADLIASDLQKKETPEAYMGYALYDSDSVLYEKGKILLSSQAENKHENLNHAFLIEKGGFIETFLVNETSQDVFFDNFRILSTPSITVQVTHYYPFGMEMPALSYQAPAINKNRYLYNGKELIEDNGLQYYDYGARMYDPAIGRWGVVDPLAEIAPDKTPYHFVSNNPINRIDPDGLTDYEINSKGEVVKTIENKKADNFYMVDNDGNRIEDQSISFDYGTVESHRSQSGTYQKRNADGTRSEEVTTIDIFKVRGDDNGTQLFEFLADNTSVEWSQAKTGIEGDKGLNFLTTGHVEYTEPGIAALINGQLSEGYTIRELNHNHPGGTAIPSGLPGLTGSLGGDVPFAKAVTEWYKIAYPNRSNSPTYKIYVTGKGYIPYSKDSKKEDYGY